MFACRDDTGQSSVCVDRKEGAQIEHGATNQRYVRQLMNYLVIDLKLSRWDGSGSPRLLFDVIDR